MGDEKMFGIFYLLSCMSGIIGGIYTLGSILFLVKLDSNFFSVFCIGVLFLSGAMFGYDLDTTISGNYKIGEDRALNEPNFTEYTNCVDYIELFESDEWNELNNRSTYRYCRGYVASYENVLESKQLLQAERNLTLSKKVVK